ncbi:MAG: UDP-3-O-acyl-N-acetylglucosamine deacetylase [Polyangia bacterium]
MSGVLSPFTVGGTGLHSGVFCSVRVAPAPRGSGIAFITDEGEVPAVPGSLAEDARRATDLARGAVRVRTVEHLLAALAWFGELDVRVGVNGPEIPVLDGSAATWVSTLRAAGAEQGPRLVDLGGSVSLDGPGGARAEITPLEAGETPRIRVEASFDHPAIGSQSAELELVNGDFVGEIAPARTFSTVEDAERLLAEGLARGGGLDNALVFGPEGPLNPSGARFSNEPARHKLLDAIGDLAVLGGLPRARIALLRPGHELLHELVRRAEPLLLNQ